jgi:hypothetical protein
MKGDTYAKSIWLLHLFYFSIRIECIQIRMSTTTGRPSIGASIGYSTNSLQLTQRGRYITLYMITQY